MVGRLLRSDRPIRGHLATQVWVLIVFCDKMHLDSMTLKVLSVRNVPMHIHQI